jgi:hypothetical protein
MHTPVLVVASSTLLREGWWMYRGVPKFWTHWKNTMFV